MLNKSFPVLIISIQQQYCKKKVLKKKQVTFFKTLQSFSLPTMEHQKESELSSTLLFTQFYKKFLGHHIKRGKKNITEKFIKLIFLNLILNGHSPLKMFLLAINNLKPVLTSRKIQRGRKTFIVPFFIPKRRQISDAIKFLFTASTQIKTNFFQQFTYELVNCANKNIKNSIALKLLNTQYRTVIENRTFRYFRWI